MRPSHDTAATDLMRLADDSGLDDALISALAEKFQRDATLPLIRSIFTLGINA